MKAFAALFTLTILVSCLYAQNKYDIRGVLQDSAGTGIAGATVKLNSATDSVSIRTEDNGTFIFNDITSLHFTLIITNLGFQTFEKEYFLGEPKNVVVLDPIELLPQSYELDQISILAKRAVIIKKDTIEYQARNYRLRENAFTEDLLKKLPGISINREGSLIAQGKMITRVKVNGKDFFGGDVETAIKNIPANLIEKIQVIDDYGDKARLTGGGDGRYEKIINIKTWANLRKGHFGNAAAGTGNEGRYQLSALGNYFNNNREIAFYGNFNNNNSGMPGSEYALSSALNGLTSVTAAGLNYRGKYNKNLSSYGSYSFSRIHNELYSQTFRQNIYPDNTIIYNTDSTRNGSIEHGHVFQWTVEYEDSLNFVQVSPSVNFKKSNTGGTSFLTQRQMYSFSSDRLSQITRETLFSSIPLVSTRIVANHKFGKTNRNIFVEINLRNSDNNSEQNADALINAYDWHGDPSLDSLQRQFLKNENEGFNAGSRISYSEPLGKRSRLEVGYAFGYSHYINDREAFRADLLRKIDTLSNRYAYSFTTHTINLSFRQSGGRHSYTLGISIQPTQLSGQSTNRYNPDHVDHVDRQGLNVVPEFNYSYSISTEKSFSVNYAASSNPPTYLQLQPVTDVTNPQYPVTGNPKLKSELWHNIDVTYNSFDIETGKTLFAGISGTFIQDQVVANAVIRRQDNLITQETLFENVNGTYMVNAMYNLSLPFSERKYILELNGSLAYNHNISVSNYEKISSRNPVFSQAIRMQINPTDKIEFYPSIVYTYNQNSYSIDEYSKYELSTWALGTSGRLNLLPDLVLGIEADKNFNKGFSGAGNNNPFILNTYLEKQFFKNKRGALRFTGFDLFDENTSVRRTILNNAILDNRSNKLGRYFMLLLTLNINKFEV